ncbi:MAG: hypothetical protein LBR11_07230 [Deltaproteobacteria bacterium]|jgi:hypothetical protein|nr:hypothetical protein [Deltaproteobacteria bacterium]
MSAKKAEEKKPAKAAPPEKKAPESKVEDEVSNAILAELDRVHVRIPRY